MYYLIFMLLQVNTTEDAETLLHLLEQAAATIGLFVNSKKTVAMKLNVDMMILDL